MNIPPTEPTLEQRIIGSGCQWEFVRRAEGFSGGEKGGMVHLLTGIGQAAMPGRQGPQQSAAGKLARSTMSWRPGSGARESFCTRAAGAASSRWWGRVFQERLAEGDPGTLADSDRKVALAGLLRRGRPSRRGIVRRLGMRRAANLSQPLRRSTLTRGADPLPASRSLSSANTSRQPLHHDPFSPWVQWASL